MDAQVLVEEHGDVVVVRPLQSRVTQRSGCKMLVRQLWDAVEDEGSDKLILDLSKVDFLCSAVLNELVVLDKRVRAKGHNWKICSPRAPVAEILQMTRLDDYFGVAESCDEGIEQLGGTPPSKVGGGAWEIE